MKCLSIFCLFFFFHLWILIVYIIHSEYKSFTCYMVTRHFLLVYHSIFHSLNRLVCVCVCVLSFIWGKMRTAAWEAASQFLETAPKRQWEEGQHTRFWWRHTILLTVWKVSGFHFYNVQFVSMFFYGFCFCCCFLVPHSRSQRFSFIFSSKNVIVLCFTCRSMIHFV